MKLSSISGVTYDVKDLARTAEFYETIGFRRGKEEPGRVTFYVNWFFVTFVAHDEEASGEPGSGVHLYIKVDDLEASRQALLSYGLTPEERGKRELVVRDPDGYQLVFFHKK